MGHFNLEEHEKQHAQKELCELPKMGCKIWKGLHV